MCWNLFFARWRPLRGHPTSTPSCIFEVLVPVRQVVSDVLVVDHGLRCCWASFWDTKQESQDGNMEFRYPGRRGRRWKIGGLYIYDPNFESWIPIRSESEMTKLVLVHSNICWIFSKLDSSSNRMRSLTMFTPFLVLIMWPRSKLPLASDWPVNENES